MSIPKAGWSGRRRVAVSLVAGLLVALAVIAAGVRMTRDRPVTWRAESTLLILPAGSIGPETLAGYFETLSRGQVVATYAEIIRSQRFEQAAARTLGLPPDSGADVSVKVIPDTAVLAVTSTAATRETAEALGQAVIDAAVRYVAVLEQPFEITMLQPALGSGRKSGHPTQILALVVATVALAVGWAAQQAVYQTLGFIFQHRQRRSEVLPVPASRMAMASPEQRPAAAEAPGESRKEDGRPTDVRDDRAEEGVAGRAAEPTSR